jgi:hypothetical protein
MQLISRIHHVIALVQLNNIREICGQRTKASKIKKGLFKFQSKIHSENGYGNPPGCLTTSRPTNTGLAVPHDAGQKNSGLFLAIPLIAAGRA